MESRRRNIELKARNSDPARALEVCQRLGAKDEGVLWQKDTYFNANHGSLKLREQSPGRAHLIQYERADWPQARESGYRIIRIDDVDALSAALGVALGIRGVVEKRRRLFLWKSVRIHLDEVNGLGNFIEFEAVAAPESDLSQEHQFVAQMKQAFAITDADLCATGYAAQLGI